MTENQIAALKYLIIVSKVAPDIAKRVMLHLIDQSAGLTQEVCVSLVAERDGYDEAAIREAGGMDAMMSANCGVHINEVMVAMGSKLHFCLHYGDFDPQREGDPFNTDGQFAGFPPDMVGGIKEYPGLVAQSLPVRYTFWLAHEFYSRSARYVPVTKEELDRIKLKKPTLEYSTPH